MRRIVVTAAVLALATPGAEAAELPYDFDGDGRQEIVVGLPRYQAAGAPDTGGVVVVRDSDHQLITRDTGDVPGVPYGDDAFGSTLASADFNGDGYADVAIGAPGDSAVHVLYGSADGVTGSHAQRIALGKATGHLYPVGATLVAADLDRDGFGDLAVGPETIGLFFGTAAGLPPRPRRRLHEPQPLAQPFGEVMAVGDVNGDGRPDLIEAARGEPFDLDGESRPGHVVYCAGTATGPRHCRRIMAARPGPASLATADVTGDGFDDIIEGIPFVRTFFDSSDIPEGTVRIVLGGPHGPGAALLLHPGSPGIPGRSAGGDLFGTSIAAHDLDRDGFADIVIGSPGARHNRGRVLVVWGAPTGYARAGNRAIDEDTAGIRGRSRAWHQFGAAVSVQADRRLVVGIPGAVDRTRGNGALSLLRLTRGSRALRNPTRIALRDLGLRARMAPDAYDTPPFGAVIGQATSASTTGFTEY